MTHKKLDIDWDEVASILPEKLTGRNAHRRWDALKKRLEKGKVLELSTPSRNSSPSRKKPTRKAPKDKKIKKQAQKEAEEHVQEANIQSKREGVISRSQSASEERSAAELEMQEKGKRKVDTMRSGSISVKSSEEDKSHFDDSGGGETPTVVTGRPRMIAKTGRHGQREGERGLFSE